MKRTIAITLTVAMIGGLMFMGFAGTAAAQNNAPDDGIQTGEINQEINQGNLNAQVGFANAEATSSGAADKKHSGAGGGATADASVNQGQIGVFQGNFAQQNANTGVNIGEPVNNQNGPT
jgi:hypothetical protein